MSSYLSTPYEISAPQESVNVQLVGTVLNKLQTKYDTNKALVAQTLEKFQSLRGISDADNEYIAARVSQAQSAMDNFTRTNGDLSRSSNFDSVMSAMKGVYADPLVQNAIKQRVRLENYETEVARVKDKNDGRYSDVNYQYGLYKANLQEYKDGKTKGLGDLNYTNHIDMSKTYLDKLESVKKLKGDRVVETVSVDGKRTITKSIKGMTDSEIREYVGTLMTAEENQQLKINGWAKFSSNETEARGLYSNYIDQRLENLDKDIKLNEADEGNNNLSEADRKEAKDKVAKYKDTKEYLLRTKSSIDSVPIDSIGQELEKANFVNGLSQLASAEWSYTQKANDVYYKEAELELKYAELQLKQEQEARKNGLKADGTVDPNNVITVSSAELSDADLGDANTQQSLQSRHDGYYKDILTVGRSVFSDQEVDKSDKDAFEAQLKARGLDRNFNVVGENAKGLSVALIIQQAFDASRIGAKYSDKANVLDNAIIKKNNIAKDIVNVESESYQETFKKDPKSYIDFLKRSQKQLNPKFSLVSDVVGNEKSLELSNQIQEFAKKAGGWENMENYLEQNPDRVREFAMLTDKADKAYKGIDSVIQGITTLITPTKGAGERVFSDKNLISDAKAKTEEILRDKTKTNTLSSFTDQNIINFTNEDVNQKIIKGLPQDKIDGNGFDYKKEFSVRLVGQNIEMLQHQGVGKAQWNNGKKDQTRATVTPGDASYNEMMKYIQAKEEETLGLNADKIGVDVPSSRPVRVNKTKNEDVAMNGAYEIHKAVVKNPNLKPIFAVVGGDPTAYAWDGKIKETVKEVLKNYPPEKVEEFTNRYLSEMEGYTLTPYVTKRYGNKEWAIKVETAKGGTIINGKSLGLKNLDENTAWLLKYQPQTFITEYLLRELLEDTEQTKINTILDGRD